MDGVCHWLGQTEGGGGREEMCWDGVGEGVEGTDVGGGGGDARGNTEAGRTSKKLQIPLRLVA